MTPDAVLAMPLARVEFVIEQAAILARESKRK